MIRIATIFFCLAITSAIDAHLITVDPATGAIASPMKVRLTVELKPGQSAEFPENINLPAGVIQTSRTVYDPVSSNNGAITQSVEYEIVSYAIGANEIRGIDYTIKGRDGSVHQMSSGSVIFAIVSVRDDPKSAQTLMDIKPPAPLEIKLSKYIMPALIFLLIALALIYLWRRLSSRKHKTTDAPTIRRAPHEIAYEKLYALKADDLFGQGLYKEHYFRLSEIMREYVERRYGTLALERTTFELRSEFDIRFETERNRSRLFNLLEVCDLVKFANSKSTPANAADSLRQAFEWIDLTKKDYSLSPGSKS